MIVGGVEVPDALVLAGVAAGGGVATKIGDWLVSRRKSSLSEVALILTGYKDEFKSLRTERDEDRKRIDILEGEIEKCIKARREAERKLDDQQRTLDDQQEEIAHLQSFLEGLGHVSVMRDGRRFTDRRMIIPTPEDAA